MSKKNIPFYFPMLSHIVFFWDNSVSVVYNLKNDYKLILSLNDFYDKFKSKNMIQLNNFFLKTFSIHWVRVAFKGKGYRLRKFRVYNKVTLNFGHSHWAKLGLDRDIYFFKKLRRQNYICSIKGYNFYKEIKSGFKRFKKLNSYTKRGLRLKKQFIRKRFGKISQVVSSLH